MESNCSTVHLHSTMLLLYQKYILNNSPTASFTFHYASTLSDVSPDPVLLILHLHSTMLLLYRRLTVVSVFSICIYIPLCFYFIGPCGPMILTVFGFTFHYASTLSLARSLKSCSDPDLHSTMLLLYLRGDCRIAGDFF